jgi:hypothetical protein
MPLCCYYEKGNEKKTICTSAPQSPVIDGWTIKGQWSVDNCRDCLDSARAVANLDSNAEGSEQVTVA